jgi:hypothetical protein
MQTRILKDKIEIPGAYDLDWYFTIEIIEAGLPSRTVRVKVDTSTLYKWFKEAIGRYPDESIGDDRQRDDILSNWSVIEPVLRRNLEACL